MPQNGATCYCCLCGANKGNAKQGVGNMASKAITTGTKGNTVARTRTTASKAQAATVAPTVAPYRLVTEASNPTLVAQAVALATPGKAQAQAATEMAPNMPSGKCTPGQLAMLCYQGGRLYNGTPLPLTRYGTTDAGAPTNPAALALAIAATRNSNNPNVNSWGRIAAAYGVTEPCARQAYTAATGTDHASTGVGGWRWRGAVQG